MRDGQWGARSAPNPTPCRRRAYVLICEMPPSGEAPTGGRNYSQRGAQGFISVAHRLYGFYLVGVVRD